MPEIGDAPEVMIFVVTGDATEGDEKRCMLTGFKAQLIGTYF